MSQRPGTSSSSAFAAAPRQNPTDAQEFNFRLPQNQKKTYSVMQFNRSDNVDLTKWKQARMERENNKIHYKTDLDDLPKFGAGSEFGRERREEARLKKYGVIAQKYKEEDQPWILKQTGSDSKTAKKYRGRKEGRVNENSNYFILAQLKDGTFEAYPVDSWYNFTAMQSYRTFNAEEAEEMFGRRDKTMNFFEVMVQKKLRDNKEDEEKEEGQPKARKSELTLMEDDLYLMSDDEGEDSDEEDGAKAKSKKGKGKKGGKTKRPKKKEFDSEAEEESDEGDFDGRELDYISEQSSDDDEVELAKTDIKGLDQELQQMEDEEEEEGEGEEEKKEEGDEKDAKKKDKDKTSEGKDSKEKKADDSSSAESSGSDSDIDEKNIHSAMLLQKKTMKKANDKTPPKSGSRSQSRSQTPTVPDNNTVIDSTLSAAAQKLESTSSKKRPVPSDTPANKRPRTESPVPGSASKTPSGHVPLTEEEVKRYLMRRPMTTKDLLVKLNPKRTGLPKGQIETKLTEILVKLKPEQRKKDNKIYWFIREHSK